MLSATGSQRSDMADVVALWTSGADRGARGTGYLRARGPMASFELRRLGRPSYVCSVGMLVVRFDERSMIRSAAARDVRGQGSSHQGCPRCWRHGSRGGAGQRASPADGPRARAVDACGSSVVALLQRVQAREPLVIFVGSLALRCQAEDLVATSRNIHVAAGVVPRPASTEYPSASPRPRPLRCPAETRATRFVELWQVYE